MPLTQRRSLRTTIYETEPRVQPYREYNWNRDLRNSSPSADQRTSQRRYQPNAEDHLPVRCQLSSGIYPIEDYSNTLPTSYRSGAKNAAHENNAEDTAIGATHAERLLLASRSRLATQRAINNEVAEYEAHSHSEAVRQRHQRRLLQMQQAQQKEISTLSKDRPSVSVSGSYFRGGTTRPNAVDASIEELGEQLSVEPSFESATKDSAVHSMVESAPQKDTSASSDPHTSSKVAELLREGLARIEQQTLLQESDVKSIASEAESILAKSPRLRERLTHIKTPEHASSDHQPCERSDEVKGHHPGREGDCVVELHNEKSPNELETIDPGPGMGATRDFRELLRTQKVLFAMHLELGSSYVYLIRDTICQFFALGLPCIAPRVCARSESLKQTLCSRATIKAKMVNPATVPMMQLPITQHCRS
eukprot:INCI18140.5.p1 GENE.INCI18140.5~~INCI18140.5.p1  ORF type:complete len:421 (+),score=47.75 INCI18140.5:189-1451(+)